MEEIYTVGQMAKKLHKSVRTLQQWDRDGILVAQRTITGRRFYTRFQLLDYYGEVEPAKERKIVAYCRVSSHAQKPDLMRQVQAVTEYCLLKNYRFEIIKEIGGGMNFKRKKFRGLLTAVKNGDVEKIVIAHKDRLTRFGFDHIEWECQQHSCKIEILNNEQMSPEQEMVQDLMTIIHCFSSRLYGLRNYKADLKRALSDKSL